MRDDSNQLPTELPDFLEKIKSPDGNVRMAAWQSAGPQGASAIAPLGELAAGSEKGVAKAATEAMRVIAHRSARPNSRESFGVTTELLKIASSDKPRMVRANALELIGYIGNARAGFGQTIITGLVKLLSDPDLREDARMTLERIPGLASMDALQKAEKQAEADKSDFKKNLAQSLYDRELTPKTVGTLPLN